MAGVAHLMTRTPLSVLQLCVHRYSLINDPHDNIQFHFSSSQTSRWKAIGFAPLVVALIDTLWHTTRYGNGGI